jgi:hypothetical protein
MITLKTITTIELSSICNLSCLYCVNRLLVKLPLRDAGIMNDYVFNRSVYWLEKLCKQGTQQEVNINGNGESCLDPQLIERAKRVKEVVGHRPVNFSTNAVNMTEELAKGLASTGIDKIDLSIHSPFHTRKAIQIMRKAGINLGINPGAVVMSHNWAGQLEPENSVEMHFTLPCDPLIEGRGYIQSEGNVTPCCYDYRNLGVFGHVFNEDLLEREIKPYELCTTCHQVIPEYIIEQHNKNNQDNPIYKVA